MTAPVRRHAAAWLALCILWTAVSLGRHPTLLLDALATGLLLGAYAAAVYANWLVLVPRYWRTRRFAAYWSALFVVSNALTAAAVGAVQIEYDLLWGADARRFGFWTNQALDLAGMALHLIGATVVARVTTRPGRARRAHRVDAPDGS